MKTIRILKKEQIRQKNWQKFMRMFRAYPKGVPIQVFDMFFKPYEKYTTP